MRTNLVKIVLVFVSMFATRHRDMVQVDELLEVWVPVGAVGQVGVLKDCLSGEIKYNNFITVKTTF